MFQAEGKTDISLPRETFHEHKKTDIKQFLRTGYQG